jgi:excisionase family DNA binding protein
MSISDGTTQPEPLAYTIAELARAVRCSERTIRRAISSGQLNVVRIGRCVRVTRESLKDFLCTPGVARHEK